MMNPNEQEDGLPEIANLTYRSKTMVIIAFLFIIVAIIYYSIGRQIKNSTPLAVEESYHVPTTTISEQKVTVVEPVTNKPEIESPEKIAYLAEQQKALHERLSAPLIIVNNNQGENMNKSMPAANTNSDDPNLQFLNHVSNQINDTHTATTVGPLNNIIAQGNLLHAILEPATNSDLPGFLRAIVSEPGYAEDGSQILIPRGSRLIGQYKSGILQGQTRIFVVWTRLITPQGISVQLGSSGVDQLGVAGMGADEIDRHFWQRFGTASLLSIIGAGAANVGANQTDQANSTSEYRTAVAESFAQSANQSLQHEVNISPTLKTYQGKPIMVFVAHDLSFKDAIQAVKPTINVF